MGGRIEFGFSFGSTPDRPSPDSGAPMRILLAGAFSGCADTAPSWRTLRIDIDNFDDVMGRLAPRVAVPGAEDGGSFELTVASLDDLHPDALFERVLRRIHQARIDIPEFAQAEEIGRVLGAVEHVGARAINSKPTCLRGRIRLHAGVNALRFEFHSFVPGH